MIPVLNHTGSYFVSVLIELYYFGLILRGDLELVVLIELYYFGLILRGDLELVVLIELYYFGLILRGDLELVVLIELYYFGLILRGDLELVVDQKTRAGLRPSFLKGIRSALVDHAHLILWSKDAKLPRNDLIVSATDKFH